MEYGSSTGVCGGKWECFVARAHVKPGTAVSIEIVSREPPNPQVVRQELA